jgi:hypothetical protein
MSDIKTTSLIRDCRDHKDHKDPKKKERHDDDDDCKPRSKCNHDVEKQNDLLRKHGALFWNRINVKIQPFDTVLIDTGIRQSERECLDPIIGVIPTDLTSIPPFTDDPTDGTGIFSITTLVPIPGALPASRVMVIPLSPISQWLTVTQPTEPFWNPNTKTVFITLANGGLQLVQLNLLVWNPSYFSGPGEADPYANMPSVLSPVNDPTP